MAWVESKGERGNRRYIVRWRETDGKKRSKSFRQLEGESGAKAFSSKVQDQIYSGSYIPVAERKIPLGLWGQTVLDGDVNLRRSTRALNQRNCKRIFAHRIALRPIGAITTTEVRQFFADLEVTPSVQEATRRLLGKFFNAAVREGLISRSPMIHIPSVRIERRRVDPIPASIVEALADAIHPPYRCMVLLAGYAGMRWGEIAALTLDRVDFLNRKITIDRALASDGKSSYMSPPKSEAGRRTIRVPTSVIEALALYVKEYGVNDDGLLFRKGGFLISQDWSRFWRRARGKVGVDIHFHDLRHTAVAQAIRAGAHPKQIQTWIGHANIGITMDTYGHLFDGMDDQLADALDDVRQEALESGKVIRL